MNPKDEATDFDNEADSGNPFSDKVCVGGRVVAVSTISCMRLSLRKL